MIFQSFKIIDRMKIYAKYCNNYDAAETLYKQKMKKKEFESFINVSIYLIMLLSTKINLKFIRILLLNNDSLKCL